MEFEVTLKEELIRRESKLGDEICNKYGAAVYIVNNAIYSVNAQLDVPLY